MMYSRSWVVVYVSVLHAIWGVLLVAYQPEPSLRLGVFYQFFGTTGTGALMALSAVTAFSSAFHHSHRFRLALLMPQQTLLTVSMLGSLYYLWLGIHPAVGLYSRESILISIIPSLVLANVHMLAILDMSGVVAWIMQLRSRSPR